MPSRVKNTVDRLQSNLVTSGLNQKDPPLYNVISDIISNLQKALQLIEAGSGGGGSGSSTTNIFPTQTILIDSISGGDGGDGDIGPPGVQGIQGLPGATGPSGPTTIGPMGIDGQDGEDGFPIPGNQGIQGIQGIQGPAGPTTIGPMGIDGEDGMDGFPIPGPQGVAGISTSPWEGNIVLCAGNGNPNVGLNSIQSLFAGPTPTNITTALGRVSYFKLASAITVANIRWYGIGATSAIYHVAIYRASDNVRMSADNTITTTANAWEAVADVFTLAAGVLYYCVVSADSAGATAGIAALTQTIAASTGQIRALPTAWAGNLDWDNGFVDSYAFAVVTVTTGVLPDPGNAPAAFSGAVTGGMPAIFLDAA